MELHEVADHGQGRAGLGALTLPPPLLFLLLLLLRALQTPTVTNSSFLHGAAAFHLGMCSPELGFGTVKYPWGYFPSATYSLVCVAPGAAWNKGFPPVPNPKHHLTIKGWLLLLIKTR